MLQGEQGLGLPKFWGSWEAQWTLLHLRASPSECSTGRSGLRAGPLQAGPTIQGQTKETSGYLPPSLQRLA